MDYELRTIDLICANCGGLMRDETKDWERKGLEMSGIALLLLQTIANFCVWALSKFDFNYSIFPMDDDILKRISLS